MQAPRDNTQRFTIQHELIAHDTDIVTALKPQNNYFLGLS